MRKWKVLESKYALDNRWMMIRQDKVELPNGTVLDDYFVYEEGDVAFVVTVLKNGNFVLVKQYKHAVKDIITEFPAGYIDKDETPEQAALRELTEETGLTCDSIEYLGTVALNPSKVENNMSIYLAKDAYIVNSGVQSLDSTEDIELMEVSFTELHKMVLSGEFKGSGSVVAFYLAAEKLGLIKPVSSSQ